MEPMKTPTFALPRPGLVALASLLAAVSPGLTAAPSFWTSPYPTAQPQSVAEQTTSEQPSNGYWSGYRYRPVQQRPGLPPNASGSPGTVVYSYSTRTPDGGYSYSYHISRSTPPAYGQQSYGPPSPAYSQGSYGTPTPPYGPQAAAANPPTVEASLSERRPLVQQNLIYRVRIHSSGNLQEAAPVVPQTEALAFRQLGEPRSYRSGAGRQEVVTEYTYLVIPLQPGTVQLPPPKITGRYTDGRPFEIEGSHGTTLYIQPAKPDVTPWLPLYDLHLEAHLSNDKRLRAGEPVTLEVITSAIGAVGSQLPSVANQLKSDDFYVYPGEVTEDGRISADGMDLLGSRIERFTLVPRYGGRLILPAVSLRWWNLRTGQPAVATLPLQEFQVAGPVGDNPRAQENVTGMGGHRSLYFWIPLLLVTLLVAAGWIKALFGRSAFRLPRVPKFPARRQLERLQRPMVAAAQRLSPQRHLHRLRAWIGRHLPTSWKLWYCLRAVDREPDPEAWEHALQILAAKHLGARSNASLQTLAGVLTGCHPAADGEELRRLLEALEEHIYGDRRIDSFEEWKAAFKRQIKPRLFPIRLRQCTLDDRKIGGLPQLNPQVSQES